MHRSLWIGGFAVGALLGTIILELGSPGPKVTAPNSITSGDRQLATTAVSPARSEQSQPQQQLPPEPTAYERMLYRVAASQGGRIAFDQIVAIARMTSSQPDSPTYEQLLAQVSEIQGGRISMNQMLALRSLGAEPSPGYDGASMYAMGRTAHAGLPQSYYDSLAAYQGVRGSSTRATDAPFESRMSGAGLPSVEAPSSSIRALPSSSSQKLMDVSSGQYMSPAAGGYTDPRNGTFYAQSGPNGVVNTRTGEFLPTH